MSTKEWREKNIEKLRKYRRDWYNKNSEHACKKVAQRKKGIRQWLQEYKSTLSCEKCGESHPACLDFHHRDEKLESVSKMRCWSINKILEEIKKCSVLCSNCHRKLHWKE